MLNINYLLTTLVKVNMQTLQGSQRGIPSKGFRILSMNGADSAPVFNLFTITMK